MSKSYAFNPESIESLATALQQAWSLISLDPLFAVAESEVLLRRLSVCLMELSADGVDDPLQLADGAVKRMREEYDTGLALAQMRPRASVF